MSTDSSLNTDARDIRNIPNYERFLRALQDATHVHRNAADSVFSAIDGTVADALAAIFEQYPQSDDLRLILGDVRRVGAVEQAKVSELEGELDLLRKPLNSWYAFIDLDPD